MNITTVDFSRLFMTDAISAVTLEQAKQKLDHYKPYPIIVAEYEGYNFILDGNHRAYIACSQDYSLNAIELEGQPNEIADLLDLERDRELQTFPHKEYLAGTQSFDELRTSAIEEARSLGFVSVQNLVEASGDFGVARDLEVPRPKMKATPASSIEDVARECVVVYSKGGEMLLPLKSGAKETVLNLGYAVVIERDPDKIRQSIDLAKCVQLDSAFKDVLDENVSPLNWEIQQSRTA